MTRPGAHGREFTLTLAGYIATIPRREECGHIVCLPLDVCVYENGEG